MARSMNLFGNTEPVSGENAQDRDIDRFILELSQALNANGVAGRHLWKGDRGYWIAYMLQLAFESGNIVRDSFANQYYWQSPNGQLYDHTGLVNGVITIPVVNVPDFWHGKETTAFAIDFLYNGTSTVEVTGLQNVFDHEYPWYYAHFLMKCCGCGDVYVIMNSGGELYPVYSKDAGIYYTAGGVGTLPYGSCVNERDLGTAVTYFKHLPNIKDKLVWTHFD